MANYNRIILIGNLTRDPEYKQLASGQAVTRLALASNRQYKNKQTGAMVQEVCFIDIDVFGPQAESCRQYLSKGSPTLVEGRLKFDTWETDGQKRSKHSIVADRVVFLSSGSAQTDVDGMTNALESEPAFDPQTSAVLDQVKAAKKAVSQRKSNESGIGSQTGELSYKDEPPFEDNLPF